MKALDTNVLVRYLTGDDPGQASRVRALFSEAAREGSSLFVPLVVVLETLWVLSNGYDVRREGCVEALEALLSLRFLEFEHRQAVIDMGRLGRSTTMDLDDLLIGLSARSSGCSSTMTFDKRASHSELFSKL